VAKKKAGKKLKMRPKKTKPSQDGIVCKALLKRVGVGDKTASIGFKIQRALLGPSALALADEVLVNARLDCTIEFDKEQAKLFPDAEPVISSVADCSSISVSSDTVGGGLSFKRDEIDLESLTMFANREATLTLKRIGDREGDEAEDAVDDREPAGGDDKAAQ
jgi:hypothetical protein